MKTLLLTLLFLLISQGSFAQVFTIDAKGIVKCPTANVGDMGTILGVTYEAVNNNLLRLRRDQGADLTRVCTSRVTDTSSLFRGTQTEEYIFNQPIGNWDFSNVTSATYMFYHSSFNQPVGNWDTSRLVNARGMFQSSPFNQAIGNWNVENVINMFAMLGETPFNQPIGEWNVAKVTDMEQMFAESLFNQPIGDWNVSSVKTMRYMFFESPFNQPIGGWDVSKVTNMERMFTGSLFNQPIGDWNVSNVSNMFGMFFGTPFNQPIGNWDVGKVTNMSLMFLRSNFNQVIGGWDVNKVIFMNEMFKESPFNQPIGDWNVRSVTTMNEMFRNSSFNQPINLWCVIKIASEPITFSQASPLTQQNKPVWGTCPGLPLAAVLTAPLNNAFSLTTRPTFEWVQEPHSTSYQLQVLESDIVVLDVLIQSAKLTLSTSLKTGTEHSWRVRGINDQRKLTGDWSPNWRFSTLFIPGPTLLAPPYNATGLSGNVQLSWSPTANTLDYQLQVSTSSTFITYMINSTVSAPPFALAAFQPGDSTSFYWRVRSNTEFGPGAWSPTWIFTRAKLTSTGDEAEVPAEYSLSQNFPNPFNPTTQISFTLPRSTTARLEVFNSLGQPVSVLADGQLPAGAHTYAFDGAALSSGVYLYRLTTPDFVQTRVMALVK